MVLFGPQWFLGIDVEFQLVFTLITFGIAIFAHNLARISKIKNYFIFSAGFLLISAGYFVRTIINSAVYFNFMPITYNSLDWMQFAGFYISSILFLGGLILLLSTAFKARDVRPTIMLYLISIIGFLFSYNKPVFLFIITSLFLVMIVYHHAKNFWMTGNKIAFTVLLGFGLVLLGQLNFLFRFNLLFYAEGHIAELLGYLVLLSATYGVAKKK